MARIEKIEIPIMMGVTARAGGKSTLLRLLSGLGEDQVLFGDTSDIIGHHRVNKTRCGLEFDTFEQNMRAGEVLPCHELIIRAVTEWLKEEGKKRKIYYFFLAGSPRHRDQSVLFLRHFRDARLIHIECGLEDVMRGVHARQKEMGSVRHDENDVALAKAWDEYRSKIIPGLIPFGDLALNVNRAEPMRDRLERAIDHMSIPRSVKKHWKQKLASRTHPVCKKVDELDGTGVYAPTNVQTRQRSYPNRTRLRLEDIVLSGDERMIFA